MAPARAFEARLSAAVARATNSVVCIQLPRRARRAIDGFPHTPSESGGSGVIIDPAGFVLTNDHVVGDHEQVFVTLPDGRRVPGLVWGRDYRGDLALVKVNAPGLRAAQLGDSQRARVGQPIFALGNALGLASSDGRASASFGVISATHRYQGGRRVYGDALQFDAPVNPGNSGGGLFDLDGRLLGVTGRISIRGMKSRSVGVGFAVPSHQVALALPTLRRGDQFEHGQLGLRFDPDRPGPGVPVVAVVAGSPAAKAGLRAGDVVLSIDDLELEHPMRLQNALSLRPSGSELRLRFRRGFKVEALTVTLRSAEKPSAPGRSR